MVKSKDIQKVRKEVDQLRKQLKITQKKLDDAWNNSRMIPYCEEQRYRALKRRLSCMEDELENMINGRYEPEKVKPWVIRRPSNESTLLSFCEV
ncbi:MAG: hypothetical protein PHR65_11645 [Syntrophomonadaceae bacterium]|nr:hypothetical protein [Syntrophomonadaceae bacterium]